MIKSYLKDESALDEEVSKVIMIVISIACAIGVGWWVWGILEKQTSQSNCSSNPSPWCTI